jgi:hypothetical protein
MRKKDKVLIAIAIFAPLGIPIAAAIKAHEVYKNKKEKKKKNEKLDNENKSRMPDRN